MTNPNVRYYISSGEKNAMRTLRRVTTGNGGATTYHDEYICNLARDFDVAMEKAKAIAGTNPVYGDAFELNDWGIGYTPKSWEKAAVAAIEMGIMPFGKHKGSNLDDIFKDEGYVKYWVEQSASNRASTVLIQKFVDAANVLGYFGKWEKEEEDKEAEKKMKQDTAKHVGVEGERITLDLKCLKVLKFEGMYGTTYYNICETREGNPVLYRGANSWDQGLCYKVKGTIKEHGFYEGVAQTSISRPTIIETIGKKEEAE